MERKWVQGFACAMGLVLALSATAFGQQLLRGSIGGAIKDDTGAALPGVTVSVSGPALQVPQIVRVSDDRGEYQVPDLPAGTYRVQYELSGFGTLVHEGIVLTSGFAAKVDVVLKVATLAETVTVSGQSPVVDVTTTRGGTTVTQDLIAAIPGQQTFRDVMLMVGGQQASNAPLVGQVNTSSQGFSGVSYGSGGGITIVDGVKTVNTSVEMANMSAYEEVAVKTFGNTADVNVSGAAVQMVVKSGGNQFHGRYAEIYQNHKFEAQNVDAELQAQGIGTGDSVVYLNDFSADLGGRIVRDKLWFYGNFRDGHSHFTATQHSLNPGPDGIYGNADDELAELNAHYEGVVGKLSYQATPNNKFISLYNFNVQDNPQYYDRYHPVEATIRLHLPMHEVKPIEWQGTLSNQLLVDMSVGLSYFGKGNNSIFNPHNGVTPWTAGAFAVLDRTTLQQSGPPFNSSTLQGVNPHNNQFTGSVNYLPKRQLLGSHALQAGYNLWLAGQDYQNPSCGAGWNCPNPATDGIGQYELIFDTVGGLAHQPIELDAKNFPVANSPKQTVNGTYVMDSWRPTSLLTVNLGVRWERQEFSAPEGTKEQGYLQPFGKAAPIGTSGPYSAVDAGSFSLISPRVGVAYDLSGNGKTVIKGTYGKFSTDLGFAYAQQFSPNQNQIIAYRWHDLNSDGLFQPGEVDFNLNGPDYISQTGAPVNINPNLKSPYTNEASASIERSLGTGMSVRGLFVYKRVINALSSTNTGVSLAVTPVNTARPYSVYDQVFNRQDPGPDGVLGTGDEGPVYTIYDYNPAYRGAAFVNNTYVNADPDRHDAFKSVEVMLTKRLTGHWFGNTSILATQSNVWRVNVVQSPNDNIFPSGSYWDLSYLLSAGYNFPHGITVAALNQMYNGLPRQRTNIFRAVDPAGGPRFPSSSTITLPMAAIGDVKGPFRNVLNLRGGKDFTFKGGRKFGASVDAFNVLNTNVAWGRSSGSQQSVLGITDASGPTYNYAFNIVQPRMIRFNAAFEF